MHRPQLSILLALKPGGRGLAVVGDAAQSTRTLDVCDEGRIRGCPNKNAVADSEAGSNRDNHLNPCKR
jgi:hypothetical protein